MTGKWASPWTYFIPTRWVFGWGALGSLAQHAEPLGKSALIVSGKHAMRAAGILERVERGLETSGIAYTTFEGVSPNPKTHEINSATTLGQQACADFIIGIGGGSALDAAKAIGVCMAHGEKIEQFLSGKLTPERTLPVIVIPTTAGTGSALSKGAIITDPVTRKKGGVRGDALFPTLALVDPELLLTVPEDVARLTAFDVLTHAIETFVSKKAQPLTQVFSLEAMKAIREALIQRPCSMDEKEQSTKLAYASTLMGINLAHSSTCLPHRIQYAIGALTDTAHAAGLASVYPEWFGRVQSVCPEKASIILEHLLPSSKGQTVKGNRRIMDLLDALEIRVTLRNLGVDTRDKMEWCIANVSGNMDVDPVWEGETTARSIIEEAYSR